VLDAGHGGMDSGANSRAPAFAEKVLTLDLARRVGQMLEASGMTVLYTRTNDVAVALDERARVARKASADVFVSIHANFAGNTNACGVETYVVTPAGFPGTPEGSAARGFQIGNVNDYHNTLLGYWIHRHLTQIEPDAPDRGLKRQSFFVLREVTCPSVLVEVGFLSNVAETKKMMTPEWQDDCARAIMRGIIEYARKVDTLSLAVNEKRQRDFEAREKAKAASAKRAAPPVAEPPKTEVPKADEPKAEAVEAVADEAVAEPPPQPKTSDTPQSVFDFYP